MEMHDEQIYGAALGALSGGFLEGTLDFLGGLDGTFMDEASGEMAMTVNIACEGSGCETAEMSEPCTSVMTGTIAWVE